MAALRLYFPALTTTTVPISPAYTSGWESTGSANARGPALTAKDAGSSTGTVIAATGTAGDDVLHRQIIAGPFAAQTIGGNFKMVSRAREDNIACDARAQLVVRCISMADGTTVLATLINFDTGAISTEWGTAFSAIRFPHAYSAGGRAVSATLSEPFYIVLEYGHRNHGTNTSTCRILASGNNGVDCIETEGDTTAADAWFEFTGGLTWATPATVGTSSDSGALSLAVNRVLAMAGTSADSGALSLTALRNLPATTGASTNSGALAMAVGKFLSMSGVSTDAGGLVNEWQLHYAGASTDSGAAAVVNLGHLYTIAMAGASANSGVVVIAVVEAPTPPLTYRQGRRLVQMYAFVLSPDANGGPGELKIDLTPYILNTVWQRSMNLSGTAAFTLPRSFPGITSILPQEDHLALWRSASGGTPRLVFQGKIASKNPGPGDVVFRAIDYLGYLQRSRTGYRTLYPTKKIGTEIISPEWVLAKTADRSPLAFVATGTIQNPLGLDGVTEITTNSKFGVVLFDRLFTFFSLAEMAMVNTDNNVVFEITLSETAPTFNFWKNRSSDRTDPVLSWPGNLAQWNYAPGYEDIVTDMASVVKKASGGQEAYVVEANSTLLDQYRRLQSAVTVESLMGLDTTTPESDQMKAAVNRLALNAQKVGKMFVALPRYNDVDPFNGWDLGDNFYTFVARAGSSIGNEVSEYLRVISVAGSWRPDGGEQLMMWLRSKNV